jgi:hypothetical protein
VEQCRYGLYGLRRTGCLHAFEKVLLRTGALYSVVWAWACCRYRRAWAITALTLLLGRILNRASG